MSFGISLAKRIPVGPVKLLQAEVSVDNRPGLSILVEDMAKAMNTPTKDLTMYVDVLPPDSGVKMYVVERAKAGLNARVKAPNVMGVCDEFRSNDISVVSPIGMAEEYFRSFQKGPPMLYENKLGGLSTRSDAVIEISKAPSHGTLNLWREDLPEVYHYVSNKDYEGLDSFEFVVSLDGQALKIIYSVKVFPEDADQNHVGYCKWPFSTWKISLAPETDTGTNNLPAWQTQSQLSALLAGHIALASQSLSGFKALPDRTTKSTLNPLSVLPHEHARKPLDAPAIQLL